MFFQVSFSQTSAFTNNNSSQCLTGNSSSFTNTSTAGATAYQWNFGYGATSGVTVAGGNGQGNAANQLKYPIDVALDAAGNLYVADADNRRIQKFATVAQVL